MPKLDIILQDITFGTLKVIVQNGRIVGIPVQEIERPGKVEGVEHIIKIKKAIEIDS